MNKPTVAVFTMSLRQFGNSDLAALNNVVHFSEQIPQENQAFSLALRYGLIDKDGQPTDLESLRDACAVEVNRRVEAGTFN